ncbi:MAG: hypothetical protein AAF708_05760 [Deinococcota bacterium]
MKHYRRSFSLLLLLLAVLAGCSQRIPDIIDPVQVEISSVQGGTVNINGPQGQASFFFPPGVLTEDTTVDAGIFDDTLPPAPNGIVLIDPSYFIGPRCLVQGQRIVPGGEVMISLPYTDAAVPSGFLESNLTILFFDKLNEAWEEVPGTTVNQTINIVQGSFGEMCVFAVGAKPDTGDMFSIDFNALPTTIAEGNTSELSWEVTSLTGNDIQTITLLEGRNGDGEVIETFEDINSPTSTGTFDVTLDETTEFTLRVTDGNVTQTERVTVNVLPTIVAEPVGPSVFRFPVPTVAEPETFSFTINEGTLNYSLQVESPEIVNVINEDDLTGTVNVGETKDIEFEVTCREAVDETVDIFSTTFGVVGSFRVICFVPPGTLRITPDFGGATAPVNAIAVVQGSDNEVNQSVNLGGAVPVELELPSGNYTITFPDATDANGVTFSPTSTQQTAFIPPDATANIAVSYFEAVTP